MWYAWPGTAERMLRRPQMCRQSDGAVVIPSVIVCRSMVARMRGLLGRADLPAGQGMLISPCRSIHTVMMQFTIDVIFLTRAGVVCRIVRNVRPQRFALGGSGAHSALEVQSGWLDESSLQCGDMLELTVATDEGALTP